MEISSIGSFLKYYERVRQRTSKLIGFIPKEKIDWTYKEGKFTLGYLIRHIAAIERYMYAENSLGNPCLYHGCGRELADGYDNVEFFFNKCHDESLAIFRDLGDDKLDQKCKTPAGIEITIWKWLRAMVEHEIHHRGQIYLYLNILGIKTPPLFGLTAEEVEGRYRF